MDVDQTDEAVMREVANGPVSVGVHDNKIWKH